VALNEKEMSTPCTIHTYTVMNDGHAAIAVMLNYVGEYCRDYCEYVEYCDACQAVFDLSGRGEGLTPPTGR